MENDSHREKSDCAAALKRHALTIIAAWTVLPAVLLLLSVAREMDRAAAFAADADEAILFDILGYVALWMAGAFGIRLGVGRLTQSEHGRTAAEGALLQSYEELEIKVRQRTAELGRANVRLKCEVEERIRAEVALRESEMKYRIVADNAYGWEFWLNTEGRFVYTSPACLEITGHGADEFAADPDLFYRIIHAEDRTVFLKHRLEVEQKLESDTVAFRIVRPDGGCRWIGHVCRPVYDNNGRYMGIRGSNRDISERKRAETAIQILNAELEQRVHKRTAQLEASNKELEDFCYAISHDLRAPLNRLEGYSRAMLEDCSALLDAQGRFYAERIEQGSLHLKRVIDALLELSRLTRSELIMQDVNLSEIARSAIEELKEMQPHRAVEFVAATDVVVKGDAGMLSLALRNLIDNAWKYTEKHPTAGIEFGVTEHERRRVYYVRDDGAGFDMQFAEKLFKPFERIHCPGEFTGNGIGLATAQRVIQRHGGRIWAEGAIEKGATFYFSI